SEYVGATAKVRDCNCQRYYGRDCRKCFNPPYPNTQPMQQQGPVVACVQLNPMRGKDDPHKIAYLDVDLPVGTKLYAAPPSAPVGVGAKPPRLLGWRTDDYLMETADKAV